MERELNARRLIKTDTLFSGMLLTITPLVLSYEFCLQLRLIYIPLENKINKLKDFEREISQILRAYSHLH